MARNIKQPIFSKKHLARQQVEQQQARIIIISTIAVIVIVLGLIAYGVLNETVFKPNSTVIKINDDKMTVKQFEEQARLYRYNMLTQYSQTYQFAQYFGSDESTMAYFQQQLDSITNELDSPSTLGQKVIDSMASDMLIRQEARRRGITVTKEEVDLAMQEAFGYYANGTPTPAPTFEVVATSTLNPIQLALVPTSTPTNTPEPTAVITATPTLEATPQPTAGPTSTPYPTATPYTEEGYKTRLSESLTELKDTSQISEATLRYAFESDLYRQKVMDAVLTELGVKPEEDKVWARHILVDTLEIAQIVEERLKNGDDFALLAKELSQDTGSASNGGDLDWFGKGQMVPEFENAAWALEIGQVSEPISSTFGYHIIQVLGHENRPLSESEYDTLKETKFSEWLANLRTASDIVINDVWKERVPSIPSLESISQSTGN